jgi:carbonic anhydrase
MESPMNVIETLVERNDEFVETRFASGLPILPRLRTLVLGCVDPRVDPAHVFGLDVGDAAVAADLAVLRDAPSIAARYRATGAVYDVATGRVDFVHS